MSNLHGLLSAHGIHEPRVSVRECGKLGVLSPTHDCHSATGLPQAKTWRRVERFMCRVAGPQLFSPS